MPNWKKVIVSGSAGNLSSLSVDTFVSASAISANQFTGSLYGTASQAISSSYSFSSSQAQNSTLFNSLSSSQFSQLVANNTFTGNNVFGNITASNAQFNTASIEYLNVIYETASVIYSSGSNQFGDASDDTQTLWGTVDIKTGPVLVTGSLYVSSGITGSLLGTSSYAVNALTSSLATTNLYTASVNSNKVTFTKGDGTTFDLTVATGSGTNTVSASFATTASYILQAVSASFSTTASFLNGSVVSASYADTASFASSFPDQGFQFTQSTGSFTWTVNHNLNTFTPLVDVYDSTYNQLIPASVSSISSNTTEITFSTAQAGFAIISKGSGISSEIAISASFATTASYAASVGINFVQSSPTGTWTIVHNLNNKYPLVQVYDSNDATIIPASIVGTSTSTVTITFSTAISGYARVI